MATKRTKAVKPPTVYKTIAAACAGMTLGKLRGPRAEIALVSGHRRFQIVDLTGRLRLDLPVVEAVMQLCKARGFVRLNLVAL